jgi:hypothetical protein
MAQDSPVASEEEITLEAHLQFAGRLIAGDRHLRVLVKTFLAHCNVLPPNGVFDVNPVQNAYNQGLQAAGFEFAALLTSADPALIPALLQEELTSNEPE